MNRDEFWDFIEYSMTEGEEQTEFLVNDLSQMNDEDIIDFERHFQQLMEESYQSSLWAAAYIINGGCSDDGFDYFRAWLISQGEEVFHETLKDPEFLAEYIQEEDIIEMEEMMNVGMDAYGLKMTDSLEWDDSLTDEFYELVGNGNSEKQVEVAVDWDEDDLEKMYPLLWERFGGRSYDY